MVTTIAVAAQDVAAIQKSMISARRASASDASAYGEGWARGSAATSRTRATSLNVRDPMNDDREGDVGNGMAPSRYHAP